MVIFYTSPTSTRVRYAAWIVCAISAASTTALLLELRAQEQEQEQAASKISEPVMAVATTQSAIQNPTTAEAKHVVVASKQATPPSYRNQHTDVSVPGLAVFSGLSQAHREMLQSNIVSHSLEDIVFARQKFVAQARNSQDSMAIEQTIGEYLARSAQSPSFDIISKVCGVDVCEIQGRVYSNAPMDDWSRLISGIDQLPWRSAFSSISSMTSEQNGQLIAITYLRLAPTETMRSHPNP